MRKLIAVLVALWPLAAYGQAQQCSPYSLCQGGGAGGSGDVVGPASSTDSQPALFDGVTGKLLKEGAATFAYGVGFGAGGFLTLKSDAAPAQTEEGRIAWDTDDDVLAIGTGAATKRFWPATGLANCQAGTAIADNAILRGDGTTGCQGSDATLDDSAVLQLGLSAGLGGKLKLGTTGAVLKSLTADTLAIRNAADGANASVLMGNKLQIGGTTSSFPELTNNGGTSTLYVARADESAMGQFVAGDLFIATGFVANRKFNAHSGGTVIASDTVNQYSNNANTTAGSADLGTSRVAAGVLGIGTGAAASTAGYFNYAGQSRVTVDTTLDSVTPATMTLTPVYDLKAGRTYSFFCEIMANTPTAADGFRIDLDGGTATATALRYYVTATDSTGAVSVSAASSATALATDLTWTSTTGDAKYQMSGTITVNAAGTFIPRYAKEADAGVAATLYRGSYCWVFDMP